MKEKWSPDYWSTDQRVTKNCHLHTSIKISENFKNKHLWWIITKLFKYINKEVLRRDILWISVAAVRRCTVKKVSLKILKHSKAPIQSVVTLQKQETFLPSLKPNVKEKLRSSVLYKITCPGCHACYVSQTIQHMITCFKEHSNQKNKPVRKHFDISIVAKLQTSEIRILAS